jgi:hypothetical protein
MRKYRCAGGDITDSHSQQLTVSGEDDLALTRDEGDRPSSETPEETPSFVLRCKFSKSNFGKSDF